MPIVFLGLSLLNKNLERYGRLRATLKSAFNPNEKKLLTGAGKFLAVLKIRVPAKQKKQSTGAENF